MTPRTSSAHVFFDRIREARDPVVMKRSATDPPVLGVEVEAFPPGNPNEGFVVCLVPESDLKPHRAEIKGRPQYHIRVSDSFKVAPVQLLRYLFYPRTRAVFEVSVAFRWEPVLPPQIRLEARLILEASLTNKGPATARDLYVVARVGPDSEPCSAITRHPAWSASGTAGEAFLVVPRPIHPGDSQHLFRASWQHGMRNAGVNRWEPACNDLTIEFDLFANDQEKQTVATSFSIPSTTEAETATKICDPVERGGGST
jgi:hypothetical protein